MSTDSQTKHLVHAEQKIRGLNPFKSSVDQVSHGFLKNPEALEPGDVRRTTASISYNRKFERGNCASSLIWGRNQESHDGEIFNLNGYVAESTLKFLDRNYFYTRLDITDDHPSFRIGAYTFGGARDIWNTEKTSLAIGSDLTFYSKPSLLDLIHGSNRFRGNCFSGCDQVR